jgi:DNA-directed RNA polymerase subunit M/transcription elongation factor TFIIS
MKNKKIKKSEEEIRKEEKKLGIIRVENDSFVSDPCPFCGSKKVIYVRSFYVWADEDEVTILKCIKCGKSFRLGSGSGLSQY